MAIAWFIAANQVKTHPHYMNRGCLFSGPRTTPSNKDLPQHKSAKNSSGLPASPLYPLRVRNHSFILKNYTFQHPLWNMEVSTPIKGHIPSSSQTFWPSAHMGGRSAPLLWINTVMPKVRPSPSVHLLSSLQLPLNNLTKRGMGKTYSFRK